MSISVNRYVNIISGQGAGVNFPQRDLIGRIFTGNTILPPQSILQFSSAADVGTYFGTNSEEYYRALFYFSWISKNNEQAQSLQFARWVNVAVAPMIFSKIGNNTSLASWTSISDGSFVLTIGAVTNVLTSLDFTGASTLLDVAEIIEDAIQAESGSGAMWTGATVTYQTSGTFGNGGFVFTGGLATVVYASANISVSVSGVGTDITGAGLLGWIPESSTGINYVPGGAIWANGSLIETITTPLINSSGLNNNFGSFLFLNNLNLTITQITSAAQWNNSENVLYLYVIPVIAANASSWSTTLSGIGGCALTLSGYTIAQIGVITSSANTVTGLQTTQGFVLGMPVTGTDIPAGTVIQTIASPTSITLSANATGSATELLTFHPFQFPEMLPMIIEAATDYSQINTVQNYMFQIDNTGSLTPLVTSDSAANGYDAQYINYYGQTQQAGTVINFYQRGVMQGETVGTNITDIGAYVNEIWLKDAVVTAIMNLFTALAEIPANNQGKGQLLTSLQGIINQALNNGTISVGKMLNTNQQVYISAATGDPKAWYQVQNIGYWVNVAIISEGSPLQYIAQYQLIYSKNDVIRLVEGTQTLI